MKSVAVPAVNKPSGYPIFMRFSPVRAETPSFIVLFHKHGHGMVVQADPGAAWPVGHYSEFGWHMPSFEPWHGVVSVEG